MFDAPEPVSASVPVGNGLRSLVDVDVTCFGGVVCWGGVVGWQPHG
jgi:hypothetical protein